MELARPHYVFFGISATLANWRGPPPFLLLFSHPLAAVSCFRAIKHLRLRYAAERPFLSSELYARVCTRLMCAYD